MTQDTLAYLSLSTLWLIVLLLFWIIFWLIRIFIKLRNVVPEDANFLLVKTQTAPTQYGVTPRPEPVPYNRGDGPHVQRYDV